LRASSNGNMTTGDASLSSLSIAGYDAEAKRVSSMEPIALPPFSALVAKKGGFRSSLARIGTGQKHAVTTAVRAPEDQSSILYYRISFRPRPVCFRTDVGPPFKTID